MLWLSFWLCFLSKFLILSTIQAHSQRLESMHTQMHVQTHMHTISPHPAASRCPSRELGKRAHGTFFTAGTNNCMRKCFSGWYTRYQPETDATPGKEKNEGTYEALYEYVCSQVCISLFFIRANYYITEMISIFLITWYYLKTEFAHLGEIWLKPVDSLDSKEWIDLLSESKCN